MTGKEEAVKDTPVPRSDFSLRTDFKELSPTREQELEATVKVPEIQIDVDKLGESLVA